MYSEIICRTFTAVTAFSLVTEKKNQFLNSCKITHSMLLRLLIIAISPTCEYLTKNYLIISLDAYQPLSGKSSTISRNSQITWHQTMKHQLVLKLRNHCQWAHTIQGRVDTKWRKETFPAAVLKAALVFATVFGTGFINTEAELWAVIVQGGVVRRKVFKSLLHY